MNIQKMMQQAQKMQKKMEESQAKLAVMEYEGKAGGDLVKVVITGKGELKDLSIDPSLVDPEEVDVLEDLIVAAFNNAKKEADDASEKEMGAAMGTMGLPAGMKLPF